MCCPFVFEFSVGIGGFCHRTESDLLLFLTMGPSLIGPHALFYRRSSGVLVLSIFNFLSVYCISGFVIGLSPISFFFS